MSSRTLTRRTQSNSPTPMIRIHRLQSVRLSKGHSRRVVVSVRASLWDLPETVQHGIQLGTGVAISLSVGLSLLPILTGDAKERNENRFNRPNAGERADNIRWGVMSILAAIPFLNPMGWVFGALDDEEFSTMYWTFAFLYSLPYLSNGFQVDTFAFSMLFVSIIHMQIERIAQTEPAEIELPEVLRKIAQGMLSAVDMLGVYGDRVGWDIRSRVKRSDEARRRRPDRKYLEEKSREERMELEDFDRRRRERERDKHDSK
jgi:hypothetical protein